MSAATLDTTPVNLLDRFRGLVVGTRLPHSKRTYLEVTEAEGGMWRLVSWYTTYSSTDTRDNFGKTVLSTALDDRSGILTVSFSDETSFTLTPIPDEAEDAVANWEIFTPEGLVLAYGPRGRWLLGRADDPDYWDGWAEPLVRF
ncbi:MAG TPA: hypothetical protein VH299_00370 [Solirubrobacterales bacterium]|jgi:hypothetical protein|nr:hypothetical protein [Solirubrobacterales bacterium]